MRDTQTAASPAPPATGSRIFISYRREDSAGHAGRLFDRVAARFGADQIFMDLRIEAGEDFVERIAEGVGGCAVLLAVIGDEWLDMRDGAGNRRLDDFEDFLRLEIVAALERPTRLVPVLVHGAVMPLARDLPAALAPLARRNAIELSDARWDYDVGRLLQTLERVLETPATPRDPPPPARMPRRTRGVPMPLVGA
ncbi:MAG: toll/interleukin-1 receptor domain-containing protein, partial [Solirubrobacterales bacterium]|nr:toll/interleukin-1 receptor domain-containing protein [Solirubrobacterales bacterium]